MNLSNDCIFMVLNYLTCEDINNLTKSGIINDYLTRNNIHNLYSKKLCDEMLDGYIKDEYKNTDVYSNPELHGRLGQFCFSGIGEFEIQLTSEQVYKLFSVLTLEQLQTMNKKLVKGYCWY